MSTINPSVSIDKSEREETQLLKLSPNEIAHFSRIDNQLKVIFKDGVMVLSYSMPEPLLAAQMADFSFKLLQKEIVNYKLGNLKEELRFTQLLYDEKKKEFEKIQNELGYFRDRNQNIIIASVENQRDRLQAEYNLKLNVFTQLANALESTKLQIARDTPNFTILDPVTIPNGPEAKKGNLIIIFSSILGVIVAFTYVLGKQFINVLKEKWSQA